MNPARCSAAVLTLLLTVVSGGAAFADCKPPQQPTETPASVTSETAVTSDGTAHCIRVSVASAQSRLQSMLLVDVRANPDANDARVTEAVPVAIALSNRTKKPLLLVGSGWNSAEERSACAQFRVAGFSDINVLDGGVRAWSRAGMPLWTANGDNTALDLLTPEQAHAAAKRGDVELVVLPSRGVPIACPQDAPHIHCAADLDAAALALERCAVATTVAIAADSAEDFAAVESLVATASSQPTLHVAGGATALRNHFEHFRSIALSANQTLWMPCHRR